MLVIKCVRMRLADYGLSLHPVYPRHRQSPRSDSRYNGLVALVYAAITARRSCAVMTAARAGDATSVATVGIRLHHEAELRIL